MNFEATVNAIKFPNRSAINLACSQCNLQFSYVIHLKKHMELIHGPNCMFSCNMCNYKTKIDSSFEMHMFCHTGIKPYKCSECNYESVAHFSLLIHKKNCSKNGDISKTLTTVNKDQPYSCLECDFTTNKEKKLREHLTAAHMERIFACYKCNFVNINKTTFIQHMKSHNREYRCNKCGYSTSSSKLMIKHKSNIHSREKGYPCIQCGIQFIEKWHLDTHLINHVNIKEVSALSSYTYSLDSKLGKLVSACYDKDTFNKIKDNKFSFIFKFYKMQTCLQKLVICAYCNIAFFEENSLKDHLINIHFNGNLFRCHCGFLATKPTMLRQHKLEVHNGNVAHHEPASSDGNQCRSSTETQNSYLCALCDNLFDSEENLKTHIENHVVFKTKQSLNVTFKCPTCPFNASETLVISHIKQIHGDDNIPYYIPFLPNDEIDLFYCVKCDYTTSWSFELKSHLQEIHHNELIYSCSYCSFLCLLNKTLLEHLNTHSDGNDETSTLSEAYTCTDCEFKTNNLDDLNVHSFFHADQKPFCCLDCTEVFTDVVSLDKHKLLHSDSKLYTPRTSFNHTDEKPYSCFQCTYICSNVDEIKIHLTIHGDKNKFFLYKTDLRSYEPE